MSKNKPRHKVKQDGMITSEYCSCCSLLHCDPMFWEPTIANLKKRKRQECGECIACGKKECSCKNKKGY